MSTDIEKNSNGIAIVFQWTGLVVALFMVTVFVTGGFDAKAHGDYPFKFTESQRKVADSIISVFENNTLKLQYEYSEALGDGRGYTAGRAGFTTATGDLHEVVQRYSKITPDHGIVKLLPELTKLRKQYSGSIKNIQQLPALWLDASKDPRFRTIQDNLVDEWYYFPALERANKQGLKYPLSLLVLYDTAIQHGNGNDKDSLQALIRYTNQEIGGNPKKGIDEVEWLYTFLNCRRKILLNPHNRSTKSVWAESVGRVDTLQNLLNQRNLSLDMPQSINPWGTEFLLDSGN